MMTPIGFNHPIDRNYMTYVHVDCYFGDLYRIILTLTYHMLT